MGHHPEGLTLRSSHTGLVFSPRLWKELTLRLSSPTSDQELELPLLEAPLLPLLPLMLLLLSRRRRRRRKNPKKRMMTWDSVSSIKGLYLLTWLTQYMTFLKKNKKKS